MRALMGLAGALARAGDIGGAISNYQELLRLNPNDNQGVRYVLLPMLIQNDQDQAEALLAKYPADVAAAWLYSGALLTFRRQGDSAHACEQLHKAFEQNRHVPEYLLDPDSADGFWPDSYAIGSDEEAIIAADECLCAWDATPGALVWLDRQVRQFRKKVRGKKPKSKSTKKKRS
jgi:tetratricopeptide (TPR) repeat protein